MFVNFHVTAIVIVALFANSHASEQFASFV